MTIAITCICRTTFVVDDEWANRKVCCPTCAAVLHASIEPDAPSEMEATPEIADESRPEIPDESTPEIPGDANGPPLDEDDTLPRVEEAEVARTDLPDLEAGIIAEEDLRLKPQDSSMPDMSVEKIEDAETTYGYIPEHARLPDVPAAATVSVAPSFWGTIGVFHLGVPAACVAYGPHNLWALAGQDEDVQILDMRAGEKADCFCEHDAMVTSVALSADGRFALSGDADGDILWWEPATRMLRRRLRRHHAPVVALAIAPSGAYALSGDEDGVTRLWELTTAGKPCRLEDTGWQEEVSAVAFSCDGRYLLAGGSEGRIDLWAVQTGEYLRSFLGADRPISSVRCDGAGGSITATGKPPDFRILGHPRVWRWDTDTCRTQKCFQQTGKPKGLPYLSALDLWGKRLLIGGRYPAVEPYHYVPFLNTAPDLLGAFLSKPKYCLEVWSLATGFRVHAFANVNDEVACLAVSSDNTRIVAALRNGNIQSFAMPPT